MRAPSRTTTRSLLLLWIVAACGTARGPSTATENAAPIVQPSADGPATELLGVDAASHVHALRFEGEELVSQRVRSGPVVHPPACARDGSWIVVADRSRLVGTQPWREAPRIEFYVPGDPVLSLHCEGLRCLLGRQGRVERIYLGSAQPTLEEVHRVSHDAKPIDFFVRLGDRLVAVDDFRMPKWALVFDHEGAFEFEASLPEETNELYVAAATSSDVMWLVSNGATISDRYNRVHRCTLAGQSFECATREEALRHDGTSTVFVGDTLTPLAGLAPTEDVAYACAGARGLLRIPMTGDVEALADTAGCLDVVGDDTRLYALLDEGRTLSVRGRDGAEIRRVSLQTSMRHLAGVSNR